MISGPSGLQNNDGRTLFNACYFTSKKGFGSNIPPKFTRNPASSEIFVIGNGIITHCAGRMAARPILDCPLFQSNAMVSLEKTSGKNTTARQTQKVPLVPPDTDYIDEEEDDENVGIDPTNPEEWEDE